MSARICPICGDASQSTAFAMLEYEAVCTGSGVCQPCAERIANAYSMKHIGKWLTWPNEAAPKPTKAVIPAALRTDVMERDKYRCLRCGTHRSLRVDHIIPESEGGPTDKANLQTLCQPCNSWKATKTIDYRGGGL